MRYSDFEKMIDLLEQADDDLNKLLIKGDDRTARIHAWMNMLRNIIWYQNGLCDLLVDE